MAPTTISPAASTPSRRELQDRRLAAARRLGQRHRRRAGASRRTTRLPTTLTPAQIQESFASPDTLSFWDLPGFIRAAQSAGFSATRYQLYLYTLYALPALFAAMVFMAASFSLRLARDGGVATVILFSALCRLRRLFLQRPRPACWASPGILPVLLAATAPAIASILIGMTLVFNQEDG